MAGYSEVSVSDGATTLSVLNIERSYLVQYTLPMNIAMSLCRGIQYFLCNTPCHPEMFQFLKDSLTCSLFSFLQLQNSVKYVMMSVIFIHNAAQTRSDC